MSKWLGAVEQVEAGAEGGRQKAARGNGRGNDGKEKKLLLQLEARMREREASDCHFKGPTGHPVFLALKEATKKYEKLVSEAGAGHEYGSPHLHAGSALLKTLAATTHEGKNEDVQCVYLAIQRLDKARETLTPADFGDWCVTCRASDLQAKNGTAPNSRLAFNFDGHWPIGLNLAQEKELSEKQFHPQEINTANGYTWVNVNRVVSLALRAAGLSKLPGKAPVGGLAYAMRNG